MLNAIEGVFRKGKIELLEKPKNISDDTRVIVTFLKSSDIDLCDRGIDEKMASAMRGRLGTFSEEWEAPEMDLYNNYDNEKAKNK